jgi:UDP-glucose:(heptosyl)LPS alpha-1,3-glucosyltransferase
LCAGPDGPAIVAISNYVADQLSRHYATPGGRVSVIPNGIELAAGADKGRADKLRKRISACFGENSDKAVIFAFAANNFRLKGLDPLIEAVAAAAAGPAAKYTCLAVAGSGKSRRYRRRAVRLKIMSRVVFLGHLDGVTDLLAAADVAVLPTFYDPSSRFILEALAAGKPVVTTAHNGAADLFADGRHGRVVPAAGDVTALAGALRYFSVARNIETASKAIAADGVRKRVAIGCAALRLDELYNRLLQEKKT